VSGLDDGGITLLFIHGTGVRKENKGFAAPLTQISAGLGKVRSDVTVESCYWGDIGARLWAGGDSFYFDRKARAGAQANGMQDQAGDDTDQTAAGERWQPSPEELELARWAQLRADPLFEVRLRLLPGPAQAGQPPEQRLEDLLSAPASLRDRILGLPARADVSAAVRDVGLTDEQFAAVTSWLTDSPEFRNAFPGAVRVDGFTERMLARALVARSLAVLAADGVEVAGQRRDEFVDHVQAGFGVADYGAWDWFGDLAKGIAGPSARWLRRHAIRQFADVLLYQSQGRPIRDAVRDRILSIPGTGPVVLLAHSLGGVIAFDLLATDTAADLHRVKLLVTVGSQVPLLYELRALSSGIGYAERLPAALRGHWFNVFDQHDMLAYAGDLLFDGDCKDIPLDTGQPFPMSHGAYWDEKTGLYDRLVEALDAAGL
jgi:hypothetical protein